MKAWVTVDENGRVTVTALGGKLEGGTEVELPDGYELERQQDWRLVDKALVCDPVQN